MSRLEERFQQRHLRQNTVLYFALYVLAALASPFGDISVLVPNLLEKMQAPAWLISMPLALNVSLAYILVLPMGWWLGGGGTRKKPYSIWVAAQALPLLLPAVLIFTGTSRETVVMALGISVVLSAVAHGLNILPCYDLFARIFPGDRHGRILGRLSTVSTVAGLVAAAVVGWLVRADGPLPYPYNYACSLVIFEVLSLAFAGANMVVKEAPSGPMENHGTFAEYCRDLAGIVRQDKPFRATLLAAGLGSSMFAVIPVFLTYAKRSAGFTDNMVALMIGVMPWILVPAILLAGYLADRVGAHRVAGGGFCAYIVASILAPLLHGWWQLAPMIFVYMGGMAYTYSLVAVMKHAPRARSHQYIALYYLSCALPGMLPMLLGGLVEKQPLVVFGATALISGLATVGLCGVGIKVERKAASGLVAE